MKITKSELRELIKECINEYINESENDISKIRNILKSDKNYNSEDGNNAGYLDDDELEDVYKVKQFFDKFITHYHDNVYIIFYDEMGIHIRMNSKENKNDLLNRYVHLYETINNDDKMYKEKEKLFNSYINTKLKPAILFAQKDTGIGKNIDFEDDIDYSTGIGGSSDKDTVFLIDFYIRLDG